jgi:hypothetical protein
MRTSSPRHQQKYCDTTRFEHLWMRVVFYSSFPNSSASA